MRYTINALSWTLTRKYWKPIVALLVLIIVYQSYKLKYQTHEVRYKISFCSRNYTVIETNAIL